MKATFYFTIILSVLVFGCKAKSGLNSKVDNSVTETNSEQKKNSDKMDTIKISGLQNNYSLKKGQKLLWVSQEHPSTGKTTEYSIKGIKVIQFDHQEKLAETENPEKGADKYQVSYYFEAVKSGSCQLVLKDMFRGEVKKERILDITVE